MKSNPTPAQPGIPPALEPGTQAFLDSLAAQGGPPIQQLPVAEARGVLTGAQSGDVPREPAEVVDRTIPGGPEGPISLRIVRPPGRAGLLPVVMYFHGGGWVLGDAGTHDRLVRGIAAGAGAVVVFVGYRRPPEARYPLPLEEAYLATRWVAGHGREELQVDPARLAVAGDSAGGNLAAAVTLLARPRGGPPILGQVLFYPVTDAALDTESYGRYAEGFFLTREAMKWFWELYAPDPATRREPTASPLRATREQLRGLPPALVVTAECDVLRDEGEAYARKLVEAGVSVTALRCLGTIHDFVMLDALRDTPAAQGAMDLACAWLRRAFDPARTP